MCITLLCRFLVNVGLSITNIFLNMEILLFFTLIAPAIRRVEFQNRQQRMA